MGFASITAEKRKTSDIESIGIKAIVRIDSGLILGLDQSNLDHDQFKADRFGCECAEDTMLLRASRSSSYHLVSVDSGHAAAVYRAAELLKYQKLIAP